ncbi:chemotaxis protein CheW [Thermoclostridium stercorarium subsp. stercorarium DSM 8532]|uniref:Chemotaxis protein CheW n=3 Tax=Thermoclostridium stercorarium TaxID=1510 RepID=L7VMN8_THES1|nr:chemotaxis protein CheW [Thermoclostridium stercorarium]AGC67726.1 chemotaxis protein CheW [Thermoclostridium stercorarium subsp. stercorarium DSM 8532]AGI38777.1 chemotaxis signal transduction protein [Thermoclostridium stercorarium subsp. stercorarium DSM 8532]ANW98140.1 chemotaxis protein CheW [Thermoclostridium stercorarium subsp. thermolacticum DSM 2910]ANX00679.1 chemotaxis protein CheW [Thermoclostridium stercorarium subsp. leptospartum DSM 9219]
MAANQKQYVVFRIDNDEYGADINKVTIIERMMTITRVPKTPPYIKGVINLRGEVLPVMDLRTRFGLPEKEADDSTRIVMVDIGNNISYGIIVDAVVEVLQVEDTAIESVTGFSGNINVDYISGVAKSGERLITLLNLERLISELIPA